MSNFIRLEKERIENIAFFLKGFMKGDENFESLEDLFAFIERISSRGMESVLSIKKWERWKLELLLKKLKFVANSLKKERRLKDMLESKFKIKVTRVFEYEPDKYVVFYVHGSRTKAVSGTAKQIKERLSKEIKANTAQ